MRRFDDRRENGAAARAILGSNCLPLPLANLLKNSRCLCVCCLLWSSLSFSSAHKQAGGTMNFH